MISMHWSTSRPLFPELIWNVPIDIPPNSGHFPLVIHFRHISLTRVTPLSIIEYSNQSFEGFATFPWKDGALPHLQYLYRLNNIYLTKTKIFLIWHIAFCDVFAGLITDRSIAFIFEIIHIVKNVRFYQSPFGKCPIPKSVIL